MNRIYSSDITYTSPDGTYTESMKIQAPGYSEILTDAPQIDYLPDCAWQLYDQVTQWKPIVSLDDADQIPSNCDTTPDNTWKQEAASCQGGQDRTTIQVSTVVPLTIGNQTQP
jgi:hypothetical protein